MGRWHSPQLPPVSGDRGSGESRKQRRNGGGTGRARVLQMVPPIADRRSPTGDATASSALLQGGDDRVFVSAPSSVVDRSFRPRIAGPTGPKRALVAGRWQRSSVAVYRWELRRRAAAPAPGYPVARTEARVAPIRQRVRCSVFGQGGCA